MPAGASKIVLTVNSFNTEQDNDRVQVYDLGTSALLGTWTGNYTTLPTVFLKYRRFGGVKWHKVPFYTSKNLFLPSRFGRGRGWDFVISKNIELIGR